MLFIGRRLPEGPRRAQDRRARLVGAQRPLLRAPRDPHPGTGVKQVRRVPLETATTVAEAQAALRHLLTERADDTLPVVVQAPKFRDYVAEYFAHYAKAKDKKRPGTLETERAHPNA